MPIPPAANYRWNTLYVQDCGDVTIPTLLQLSAELVPLVRHDLLVALDDEDWGGDGDGVLEAVRLRHGDW